MAFANQEKLITLPTGPSQEPAIEMNDLTKIYGSLTAVSSLNLTIPQGVIFGFLGPNGAGKTTTIRMLLGLIKPSSGNARILGHDIGLERPKILPQVGAIVESPTFYPYLSGRDNLRELARVLGGVPSSRIEEVLELVELSPRAKDKVKTYSLGMKQRLGIAAALLNRPRLIFLDEPTNGLDPQGTVDMRNLILQLGQSGHTVFLSSHLLHEVEQVCSHVAIINKGKLIVQGEVQQLLHGQGTVNLEVSPVSAAVEILSNRFVQKGLVKTLGSNQLQTSLSAERVPEAVQALVEAGVRIYSVAPYKASLEDYFLAITGTEADSAASPELEFEATA
jgi:ABC-type multidrug transport system ATPase subunit